MTGADAPTTSGSAAPTEAAASGAKMTFKGAARLVLVAKRFQGASFRFVLLSMISFLLGLSVALVSSLNLLVLLKGTKAMG